jgi:predicted pyridoxine 5'-phosphate oxidase superfamily flavin-nucleotide-binding protein
LVQIPEEAVSLILKNGNVVLVGSVDAKGIPNIAPRFVLAVLENEKLLFADAFKNKTFSNIRAWKKVAVTVMDKQTMGGFQLKGDAIEVEDKELIAQAHAKLKEYGINAKPEKAWTLNVNEVYSLKPDSSSKTPLISAYG